MPTASSSASPSPDVSRPSSSHGKVVADAISVETLVQHLLDAKQSLSSMTLVLRANDIATAARQAHEESVLLSAQTHFIRSGINEQAQLLYKVKRRIANTRKAGKRQFEDTIASLDAADGRLQDTMHSLRRTIVESALRPKGEEQRNLLDFVDENEVEKMRDAIKKNIGTLKTIETSFDGDLYRFESDLRILKEAFFSASANSSPSNSSTFEPISHLLSSLTTHSHAMAELLASLTKHFDLCVTAVRTTEGGAALARRKAAEATECGVDNVSISGVIAEQESHTSELEPITSEDRAEMLQVVVQDAAEVEDVVQEIKERLDALTNDYESLSAQVDQIQSAYARSLQAFRILENVGSRLGDHIAAEAEFKARWSEEQAVVYQQMQEMEDLRKIYEHYASAYDRLILEVERRRAQESKAMSVWKKARETVGNIIEEDKRHRENFRQDVGEYLPTDLWPGMDEGMKVWDVVPVQQHSSEGSGSSSTPTLDKSVVQAAAKRLQQSPP